ncbi:MAG: MFS transporter [Gammaproteobacteria bacterium]|nr:MFS transporter [Gammaproteobacteria bacterium]
MSSLTRQQSAVLLFSLLTVAIGQSLVFAILPPLGREVHLSELQITSIIAVSALVFGVASPFWGRFSDRVGRKPVILIGLLGYSLGTLVFASLFQAALMGVVASGILFYGLVLVSRCGQAVIMSATSPACTAYAADHSPPEKRTKAMAKLGAANSLGTILGPAVSGALATLGLLAPLFFAGLLTAVAAVVTLVKLPRAPPNELTTRSVRKRLRYRDPRVVRFLVAAVGLFTGFSAIQQTLGFSVQDRLLLSGIETAQMTGAALMVSAVFAFMAQWLIVQKLNFEPEQFVLGGLVSLLMATFFIGSFETFGFLSIGMAFMGTGLGLSMPSISAGASLAVTPEEQGAVAGLVASCPAAGFVIGPVAAGWLYQQDETWASIFSATVFVLLLFIMLITHKRS